MAKFTVVGVAGDTHQRFRLRVEAPDAFEAEVRARADLALGGVDLLVGAVVEGTCACVDEDPWEDHEKSNRLELAVRMAMGEMETAAASQREPPLPSGRYCLEDNGELSRCA